MPREEPSGVDVNRELSEPLGGIPLRSEEIGYAQSELTKCPKCSRPNSPERSECLYCGAVLGVREKEISVDRTAPESWENGCNLILLGSDGGDVSITAAAKIVGLPQEVVADAVNAERPLPLIRVKDRATAEVLSRSLSEHGFETKVIEDAEMRPSENPRRIRSIEFGEGEITFTDFNTLEKITVGNSDIELIVSGKFLTTRIESTEKLSRKKEPKVIGRAELSTDTLLLDIYIRGDANGSRVISTGFDFSCLGKNKAMFVADNMAALTEKIRSLADAAKFIGDYDDCRQVLNVVWPVAKRRDSKGMRRSIFKGSSVESVMTSDNLDQFTRFSRLSRILL